MPGRNRYGIDLIAAMIFGKVERFIGGADDICLIGKLRIMRRRVSGDPLTDCDSVEFAEAVLDAQTFNGLHNLTRDDPGAFLVGIRQDSCKLFAAKSRDDIGITLE